MPTIVIICVFCREIGRIPPITGLRITPPTKQWGFSIDILE